jgi:hypothetical protein
LVELAQSFLLIGSDDSVGMPANNGDPHSPFPRLGGPYVTLLTDAGDDILLACIV